MTVYTVHEPPRPPADRLDRAEQLLFVKDGFSASAMILTPFWLVANRLWSGLLIYVAGVAALIILFEALGGGARWIALALAAAHIAVGLEADSLKRWALERRGWRMLGSVGGRRREDCERRFFETWLPGQAVIAPTGLGSPSSELAATFDNPPPRRGWRGLLGVRT